MAAPGAASTPTEWQFLQCFGERTPGEDIQEGKWARSNSPVHVQHKCAAPGTAYEALKLSCNRDD